MRTVTVENTNGDTRGIKIRSLTRKEVKALKEYGFTQFGPVVKADTVDDAVDKAFERVLSPDDLAFLDECGMKYTSAVWQGLVKETYGSGEEEKNSETTTGGTSTGSE